jgi:hypothetical protein
MDANPADGSLIAKRGLPAGFHTVAPLTAKRPTHSTRRKSPKPLFRHQVGGIRWKLFYVPPSPRTKSPCHLGTLVLVGGEATHAFLPNVTSKPPQSCRVCVKTAWPSAACIPALRESEDRQLPDGLRGFEEAQG